MNKYYYEGKTKEQAEELALEELKVSKEDLIINSTEEKNNLLKKSVKIEVLNMNEIVAVSYTHLIFYSYYFYYFI